MMSNGQLKVSTHGPVAIWTISNPEARNALSAQIYQEALPAIKAFEKDPNLRVAVLQGEDGFFCAGGNLRRLIQNRSQPYDVQRESIHQLHLWIDSIRNCTKPIIAAVDGAAAGAGFSLALACDLIVASPTAKFVMSYVNVGLTPDGGGSFALSRRLPAQLAFELCATGSPITAERLATMGVVNRLATGEGPAPSSTVALSWALELAEKAPQAIANIKALIRSAQSQTWEAHLVAERESFVSQLHSEEGRIGIDAFLAKQQPQYPK